METMPYRPELDVAATIPFSTGDIIHSDWQQRLPVLTGTTVRLRELRLTDAPSLLAMLTTEEVTRFISPPPTTVEGFERFIAWTLRKWDEGTFACFAVTAAGCDTAIGIFQVRALDADFSTAEWGFVIGSPFWGTGVFEEGARLVIDFAFTSLGVHRLEARCAVRNGRGNGALRKIGAVHEGVLRKAFLKNGEYLDQALYAIVEDDWRASKAPERMFPMIVH